MNNIVAICLFLLLTLGSALAGAHAPGHSYLFLSFDEGGAAGRVELPQAELVRAFGKDKVFFAGDPNRVAALADAEAVRAYVDEHLQFLVADRALDTVWTDGAVLDIEGMTFAVLHFRLDTAAGLPDVLQIELDFITEALRDHRVGLVVEDNPITGVAGNHAQLSFFFSSGKNSFDYHIAGQSLLQRVLNFVYEGVVHIWLGFDHVLFVVSLLLAAVVGQRSRVLAPQNEIQPQIELRQALINVVTIVTVFTVAHSITLALALKGYVVLPSRIVESIIALSVLLVAIDNIRPIFGRWKWIVVFLFGLFHGLGFASVLLALGLDFQSKVVALIGFNVGVELGQLAIVAVLFPILFMLRRFQYRRFVLIPGSVAIGAVACWWFISRVFELDSTWMNF